MKYIRAFFFYLQDVLECKSLVFVWFLISLINPLLYLFFWNGAFDPSNPVGFSSLNEIWSYYFLYLILGALLMAHIEHDVAYWDIKEGGLVKYILKPFSYFIHKFIQELTWRIIMGAVAMATTALIFIFFGQLFFFTLTVDQWFFVIVSLILALLLSFVFKMIIGIAAFWIVDFGGLEQLTFVITILFSGFVVPLDMFPGYLKVIASFLPIPYMLYYPIRMVQAKLSYGESLSVIAMQFFWIVVLTLLYKFMWKRGIRRFTGVGF